MGATYESITLDMGVEKGFKLMLIISAVLHLAGIVFGFVILPEFASHRRHLPPIYTVNLVSMLPSTPAAHAGLDSAKPKVSPPALSRKPAKKNAELLPLGHIADKQSRTPTIEKMNKSPVTVQRTRRVDPTKEIDRAVSRLKTTTQDKESADKRIDAALAKLESNISDAGTGSSYGLKGTGPPSEVEVAEQEYYIVITNRINANWNMPPDSLIQKKGDLVAIYIIQIDSSGKIIKGWYEKRSGDNFFDLSVKKAITRSDPLPPPPGGSLELGLRFTPSGLKRN